jgi:predicted GH43/DUF377 family glycosyl hydrolase
MNPIIFPRQGTDWEVDGTFNPGAVAAGRVVHLLYRAVDANRISRLGYARSLNGVDFNYRPENPVLEATAAWEEFGCEDPRLTPLDGTYYVTYTAYSRRGARIALASTKDFSRFEKYGLVGPDRHDKDCALFPEEINGRIAMLHRLGSTIQIAYFESLDAIKHSQKFWSEYVTHYQDFEIMRPKFSWDEWKIGMGPTPVRTDRGWLVIYHGVSSERIYRVGAVLLDLEDPANVIGRTSEPILEPETEFEKRGIVPNVVFPTGAVLWDGDLLIYYGGADKVCCGARVAIDELLDELEKNA